MNRLSTFRSRLPAGPRLSAARACVGFVSALCVLVAPACRNDVRAAGQAAAGVRQPAVAGQFYPADARALGATLDAVLGDALGSSGDRPYAIVVPHAGYAYSAQIAADGWNQAAGQSIETIVLLGTNHTTAGFDRIAVLPGTGIRTPLGVMPLDRELSSALVKEDSDCVADASLHAKEHSIEVQVPFAQRLFPKATIVAAIVASENPKVIAKFGATLARLLAGRRTLIVASSDLSHWPAWADANAADRRTLEAIASLDPERVRAATSQAGRITSLATCACGEPAVTAAMTAARAMGATRGRVISYANSGDLPVGEPDRVVGYGAVVFSAGAGGPDASVLLPAAPAAHALPPSSNDKRRMLTLARETIRRYLDVGSVPLARGFSASLERPQGVFVTLRKRGELRGCIGQMTPDRPLRVLVGTMALAAAFDDPRFEKVRASELKDIEIEISVLTPFKQVPGPTSIVVGRDGVLLEKDRRSAVFLPQVAIEEHWTRDEMLDNLCMKGGLREGCWRSGARLSTFQADVFKDGDFK